MESEIEPLSFASLHKDSVLKESPEGNKICQSDVQNNESDIEDNSEINFRECVECGKSYVSSSWNICCEQCINNLKSAENNVPNAEGKEEFEELDLANNNHFGISCINAFSLQKNEVIGVCVKLQQSDPPWGATTEPNNMVQGNSYRNDRDSSREILTCSSEQEEETAVSNDCPLQLETKEIKRSTTLLSLECCNCSGTFTSSSWRLCCDVCVGMLQSDGTGNDQPYTEAKKVVTQPKEGDGDYQENKGQISRNGCKRDKAPVHQKQMNNISRLKARSHANYRMNSCSCCGKKFFSWFNLQRHYYFSASRKKFNLNLSMVRCRNNIFRRCNYNMLFKNKGYLFRNKIPIWKQCETTAIRQGKQISGKQEQAADTLELSNIGTSSDSKSSSDTNGSKHSLTCIHCGRKFLSAANVRLHIKRGACKGLPNKGPKWKCPICGKRFKRRDHCMLHIKKHSKISLNTSEVRTGACNENRERKPLYIASSQACENNYIKEMSNVSTSSKGGSSSNTNDSIHSSRCIHCGQKFLSPANVCLHIKRGACKGLPRQEPPWKCPICEKRFKRRDHCVLHIKTHSKIPPNTSEVSTGACNEDRGRKPLYIASSQTYKDDSIKEMSNVSISSEGRSSSNTNDSIHSSRCIHCGKKFLSPAHVCLHIKRGACKGIPNQEPPWKCPICEKRFKRRDCCVLHIKTHSKIPPNTSEVSTGACNEDRGRKPLYIASSQTYKYDSIKEMSNVSISSEGRSSSNTNDSIHSSRCIHCGKKFLSSAHVCLHIKRGACKGIPNQEPPWKCPICEKRFKRRDCCVLHIKTHSKIPPNTSEVSTGACNEDRGRKPLYIASSQTYKYDSIKEMSNVSISSEGRSSSNTNDSIHSSRCIHCGKNFLSPAHVCLHIKRGACKGIPNQEPPWKCPICEKRFKRRDCCVLHIKTHSKIPPNTSEVSTGACNEDRGRKPLYIASSQTYKYDSIKEMSNVSTSSKGGSSSNTNDSIHSSRYIHCGQKFLSPANVCLHIKRGACKGLPRQEPQWKCPICEKRFKRRDHSVLHIKTHSKIPPNTSEVSTGACNEDRGRKPLYIASSQTYKYDSIKEMSNVSTSSEGRSSSNTNDSTHSSRCIHCGKKFLSSAHVCLHIKRGACKGIPNQEPQWKCPICEKRFKRRDCCVLHIKTHSKIPPNTSEVSTGACNEGKGRKPLYIASSQTYKDNSIKVVTQAKEGNGDHPGNKGQISRNEGKSDKTTVHQKQNNNICRLKAHIHANYTMNSCGCCGKKFFSWFNLQRHHYFSVCRKNFKLNSSLSRCRNNIYRHCNYTMQFKKKGSFFKFRKNKITFWKQCVATDDRQGKPISGKHGQAADTLDIRTTRRMLSLECCKCLRMFTSSAFRLCCNICVRKLRSSDESGNDQPYPERKEEMSNVGISSEDDNSSSDSDDSKLSSICIYCDKKFISATNVQIHIKRGACKGLPNQEPEWKCPLCEKRFKRRDCCMLHIKTHSNIPPNTSEASTVAGNENRGRKPLYTASSQICEDKSIKVHSGTNTVKRSGRNNVQTQQPQSSSTNTLIEYKPVRCIFNCSVCEEQFHSEIDLKNHNEIFHSKESSTESAQMQQNTKCRDDKRYKCKSCTSMFRTKHSLKLHCRVIHLSVADRFIDIRNCKMCGLNHKKCKSKKKSSQGCYVCEECGKSWKTRGDLRKHKEHVHINARLYKCDVCGKAFNSKYYMERVHVLVHTSEQRYMCATCGKTFSTMLSLKSHSIYHSDKKFLCNICDKKFFTKQSLKQHLRSHSDERAYKCKICEQTFKVETALLRHILIHTGDQPYECKECGRKFNQCNSLKRHQRLHTGERPYQCHLCEKVFIQSISLTKHLATHNKNK